MMDMNTMNHSNDPSFCPFDSLVIEQLDAEHTVRDSRKLCGRMPAPLLSFTETVELHFVTDISGSAAGFRLEYTVIGCGELLRSTSGQIHSPGYPATNAGRSDCNWDIEVPYGNLIELTLHDYDMRQSANCSAEGVAISHERNVTAERLARNSTVSTFCGRRPDGHGPDVITSHANRLFVRLYSEGAYSGRGFNATYRMRPISECGFA